LRAAIGSLYPLSTLHYPLLLVAAAEPIEQPQEGHEQRDDDGADDEAQHHDHERLEQADERFNGDIDLFPEYTGNLLQFYSPDTTATTPDAVYAELKDALPKGLTVLDQATATDQDSYNVTADFASANNLKSLADLKKVTTPLTLGGNAELEERPYGPKGLLATYGATVGFSATGDTTVEDLLAGTINIANVYSADPRIQTDKLVTLADPEGLFLASNVVPLVNADIADSIADVINAVQAKLTPEGLVALNVESTVDQKSPEDIAKKWLTDNKLLK
jgi:osmoprotectant transport system substrate-binding protein